MRKAVAIIILALFSAGWCGWYLFELIATNLGDCGDDHFCEVAQQTGPSLAFWRGMAVELCAVLAFRFFCKLRDM